jgi:hypothetical protein
MICFKRLILVLAALVFGVPISGMTRKARIYNIESGAKLEIGFKFKFYSGHGQIVGKGPTGNALEGEYSIGGMNAGWGQIYSNGKTTTVTTVGLTDRRGALFATDGSGFTIHCEFLTDATTTHGSGACKDNGGHIYQLMY